MHSFFVPLTEGADAQSREARLRREVDLLLRPEHPLHVTAWDMGSSEGGGDVPVDWVHVLAIRERVRERVFGVLQDVAAPRDRVHDRYARCRPGDRAG